MTVRTVAQPAETTTTAPVSLPDTEIARSSGAVTENPAESATTSEETTTCLNCGCPQVMKFCPKCGQQATSPIQPVQDLVTDAAGEFLKFDSKLLVTLKALLLRPGFLTNEYLAGRRAPYIAPLRLYLWVSAFYFILFSLGPQKELEKSFRIPDRNGGTVATITAAPTRPASSAPSAPSTVQTVPDTAPQARSTAASREKRKETILERLPRRIEEGGKWFSSNMATIMIFLIPVNALFLMGLFRGAKRLYIEHLILLLHVQSFGMLAAMPFIWTGVLYVNQALSLVLNTGYAFFAMRAVYRQSVGLTLLKVFLYTMGYFLVSMVLGIIIAIAFIFLPG
jgi:hypothetical protein